MLRISKKKTFQGGIPWRKINFERMKEENNKKNVAKCLFCNKILKNIGYKSTHGQPAKPFIRLGYYELYRKRFRI